MTIQQLALLEWNYDLPPGFLVNRQALFAEYEVDLYELSIRLARAKFVASVLSKHISDILEPTIGDSCP